MRISDIIEEFIKDLFKGDEEYVEIQRNELAEKFNCVPSQINYVISTRFRPSQGYYVESKRGDWRFSPPDSQTDRWYFVARANKPESQKGS